MTELLEYTNSMTGTVQLVRRGGDSQIIAHYSNGVFVTCFVLTEEPGKDGMLAASLVIESPRRVKRGQRKRLEELGWLHMGPRSRYGFPPLASEAEVRSAVALLLLALQDGFKVTAKEIFHDANSRAFVEPVVSRVREESLEGHSNRLGRSSQSNVDALEEAIAGWNAAANEQGLPRCDTEIGMDYSGARFAMIPEILITGTNVGADIKETEAGIELVFGINQEGNPPPDDMAACLGPLLPEGFRLKIGAGPGSEHLYLHCGIQAAQSQELQTLWDLGFRSALVAWATTYPWDRDAPLDAMELGFPDEAFGDEETVFEYTGTGQIVSELLPVAAAHMSDIVAERNPKGGFVSIGYDVGSMTHLELLRAAATGYATEELVDVFGMWLGTELGHGWENLHCVQPESMSMLYDIKLDHMVEPSTWTYQAFHLVEDSNSAKLLSLGWLPGREEWEFVIPEDASPYEAGIVAARTIASVGLMDIRQQVWMFLNVPKDREEVLRDYIRTGVLSV